MNNDTKKKIFIALGVGVAGTLFNHNSHCRFYHLWRGRRQKEDKIGCKEGWIGISKKKIIAWQKNEQIDKGKHNGKYIKKGKKR